MAHRFKRLEGMTTEDKKLPAKEALLIAAEKLFTEKGYDAVSTRELADEAQVNLGAIQYHFGSKEQLFVETIRRLMQARCSANESLTQCCQLNSKADAIRQLQLFFQSFLQDICNPRGPNVCKLMYREVHDTTAPESKMFETLVSSVVNEFILPVDDHLKKVVKLLVPDINEDTVSLVNHSIIGQCTFYVTHRPFIERLRNLDFSDQEKFAQIAQHLTFFTLRGLGLTEKEIEKAFNN